MKDWIQVIGGGLVVAALIGGAIYVGVLNWNECRSIHSLLYCITRH